MLLEKERLDTAAGMATKQFLEPTILLEISVEITIYLKPGMYPAVERS